MVDLISFGGQPVLVVGAILVVTVVLSRIDLGGAAIVRGGFAAVPTRRHFTEKVVEQVRHFFNADGECKWTGENDGTCSKVDKRVSTNCKIETSLCFDLMMGLCLSYLFLVTVKW